MLLAQATRPADNGSVIWNDLWPALQHTWQYTPASGWLILLAAIAGSMAAGRITRNVLKKIGRHEHHAGREIRGVAFNAAAAPASLAICTVGLAIGLSNLVLFGDARWAAGRLILFLCILAVGWFCFRFIGVIDLAVRRYALRDESLSAQVAPMIRRTLRLAVGVVVVLVTANAVFGRDISAWLAGFGIAGIAITLAAQDSIKNFFGSLTVLFDRPYRIGDRIVFDNREGHVVDIGFRSTKMRMLTGPIVTIPNSLIVNSSVVNVSRRAFVERVTDVNLAANASPEQIDTALSTIRSLLAEPELTDPLAVDALAPRAHCVGFAQTGLTIRVCYAYRVAPDIGEALQHGETLMLRILRELSGKGINVISIAPSRTASPASDV
jgi:MscS family membrane protein